MFEDADVALLEEMLARESANAIKFEITYEEYLLGRLQDYREAPLLEFARQVSHADLAAMTDAEAIKRLIAVEEGIARAHALRARLVTRIAENRPASADRPGDQPGAAATPAEDCDKDVGPEVLDVSEWLPHELQMAHPYSCTAAQELVQASLVLTGRLAATWELLAAGRIDYRRAQIMADLLGQCSPEVAWIVQAMVLPKAPGLTPGGLATAVRRALARVDAAALRRRHARARKAANVGYYPTHDGMARLFADLPLPVAAACADAIDTYAAGQHNDGDTRPIGMIRTDILTDLILRPWDTTRPAVTADVTIHLTIPTTSTTEGTRWDEDGAEADVDGQIITAAQCRDLLGQLDSSRLFLALHDQQGGLTAVATPAQLRRAARRRRGLRPPPDTPGYRPTPAQDRHIRTRDRGCRHFGCTRKAIHADLDHHHPWPAGKTGTCNLCTYCRTHHRLKHQAPRWTRQLAADATLTITTPTGITRTTRPPGTEWPLTPEDLLPARSTPGQDTSRRPHATQPDNDPPPF